MPWVKNKATGKREWFPSGGVSRNTVQEMIDKSGHVYSVNGQTGEVKLSAEDVGAVGSEELPAAIDTALEQAKESGEFDGESVTVTNVSESSADGGANVVTFSDGKKVTIKNGSKGSSGSNGVSATHSWNGTTLTVTSASGTSSANLKGDKGDTGATGATGPAGAAGHTPVKGTDYFTAADKQELVNAVLAALPVYNGEVEAV